MKRCFQLYARRLDASGSHVPFLAPWWGVPAEDAASLHRGQFDSWAAAQPAGYELVDRPEDADLLVLSIPWKLTRGQPAIRAFADAEIRSAAQLGRQIVIFFDSDHDEAVAWPAHALVFRFSISSDTRRPNEFAIPVFSQDFLATRPGGVLRLREKTAIPSVGFCGFAPPLGGRFSVASLRESARYAAYRLGLLERRRRWIAHAPRVQALLALRRTRGVEARFILRDSFAFNRWGVLQPGGTAGTADRQRGEFLGNLAGADYALCVRGLANCSIRFSEALSLGRIPLVVDTHGVLPGEEAVDWDAVCLRVAERDLPAIGRILRERHARMPAEEFAHRQRLGRALFERWLSPAGFFTQMHRYFAATPAAVSR